MFKKKRHPVLVFLFVLIVAVVVITNLVYRPIVVDGESMRPTFESGDWLLVCRVIEPQRGDAILTGADNEYNTRMIKRLIAKGGDIVDVDAKNKTVYINGKPLDEPYVRDCKWSQGTTKFPLIVPEGYVFVLGDNRENSMDSRYTEVGLMREDKIFGTIITKIWSVNGQ